MKATLRRIDDVALYALKGDFDATVLEPFRREVDRILDGEVRSLVIDAHGVRFMSSSGLRALVETRRRCRELGGELAVSRPSAAVRHIVDQLSLSNVLPLYGDEPAACAAVVA